MRTTRETCGRSGILRRRFIRKGDKTDRDGVVTIGLYNFRPCSLGFSAVESSKT